MGSRAGLAAILRLSPPASIGATGTQVGPGGSLCTPGENGLAFGAVDRKSNCVYGKTAATWPTVRAPRHAVPKTHLPAADTNEVDLADVIGQEARPLLLATPALCEARGARLRARGRHRLAAQGRYDESAL